MSLGTSLPRTGAVTCDEDHGFGALHTRFHSATRPFDGRCACEWRRMSRRPRPTSAGTLNHRAYRGLRSSRTSITRAPTMKATVIGTVIGRWPGEHSVSALALKYEATSAEHHHHHHHHHQHHRRLRSSGGAKLADLCGSASSRRSTSRRASRSSDGFAELDFTSDAALAVSTNLTPSPRTTAGRAPCP